MHFTFALPFPEVLQSQALPLLLCNRRHEGLVVLYTGLRSNPGLQDGIDSGLVGVPFLLVQSHLHTCRLRWVTSSAN